MPHQVARRPYGRSRSRSLKAPKSPKSSSPSTSRRSTSALPSPLEPILDLAARVRRSGAATPTATSTSFFSRKDANYSTRRPSILEAQSEYNLLRVSALASGSLVVVLLFGLLVYVALWMPKRPAALPDVEDKPTTCNVVSPQQLEVETTSGKAYGQLGTIVDDSDNTTRGILRNFFGLPYGMAPTGTRRFAMATASSYFLPDGSWHSEAHGPPCPQNGPLYEDSAEDCLTLSIWAPFVCNGSESLKPAVVAIAGQWLQTGDIREHADYWQELAYSGDMVVVSVNHRLGVMGFFSGDTVDSPGNVGIYDLFLALSWIHSNVAAFHGDPDSLVALGYGSGAFLLSLDLLAKNITRRFFRRLVLHGLSVDTMFPRNDVSTSVNTVRTAAVPCPVSDQQLSSVTKCLRSKSSKEILDFVNLTLPLRFVPSRHSPPLIFPPYTDLSTRLLAVDNVDMVIGYSELEGSALFDDYLVPSLMLNDSMPTYDVFQQCLLFYAEWMGGSYKKLEASVRKSLEKPNFQGFREYLTYFTVACPTAELARAASAKGATVYHYASLKTQDFFEPVLSFEEIIDFARTGKVKWTPYSSNETTLVVEGDNRKEELHWRLLECKSVQYLKGKPETANTSGFP